MSQPTGTAAQKALQEELRELVDVVEPSGLVDLLLERSFQAGTTDLHFDPGPEGLRVRARVDGLLHDILNLRSTIGSQVLSRLKLMANMDITKNRIPQDGHISQAALTVQRDVRVGSGPTIYGERLVCRLMPDPSHLTSLESLGMDETQIGHVREFIKAPYGMILSSGPVGSGKSTTMYACLGELNAPDKSVVTIEDPVERRMSGTVQVQVEPRQEFGFVEALRGTLRQDPNVLMIGEIRDPVSAQIGTRAGLTGVLVLSTIHANDTASTVDVLREFGIPEMFIAEAIEGIVSQRLVRRVCPHCRITYEPDAATCELLGIEAEKAADTRLAMGNGCAHCFQTGHQGRTGIFEVLPVQGDVRQAIRDGKSHGEIREVAKASGIQSLNDAIREKVLEGVCSVTELHQVYTATAR